MPRSHRLVILGEPASKSNARRLVTIGGKPRFIKSKKALEYLKSLKEQVTPLDELLEGDLRFMAEIYYASRRPDLDESLILDALQGLLYKNDRQIKQKEVYWGLDKDNPRAEICVEEVPDAEKTP